MGTNDDQTDHEMTCEVCRQTFASRQDLQEHQREDHEMDAPADTTQPIQDAPAADLPSAGPSSGERPASPVQHGA